MNKYLYLLVIQGFYGYGYGWEDLCQYKRSEYKEARSDLREYRLAKPYASHRLVNRREPNPNYPKG